MKTSELTDIALDWAVAEAAGLEYTFDTYIGSDECDPMPLVIVNGRQWNPGTLWSQGGPIIEREGISTWVFDDVIWKAQNPFASGVDQVFEGPTPLIAAMRCFIASKLGDEVDVPDELKGE